MIRRRGAPFLAVAALVLAASVFVFRALDHGRVPGRLAPPELGAGDSGLGVEHAATGAWYEIAFTDPRYPDIRGDRAGGLDERLVRLMDQAQRTLDVAVYDLDLENVADAMARAAGRGVGVRVVTDTDTVNNTGHRFVQSALTVLRGADIPIVHDNRRAIMHHKFTVVDGEWVQTGSWNYTYADTYRHNNHSIVIHSRALAENYTTEFEKLFGREFGALKAASVPHPSLSIAGARVESYFSPQDRGAAHVIRWVSSARESIHFVAFSFTHKGIGDAMLERARSGVHVAGVFETSGSDSQFSEFARLKQAGLAVLQDGNPWIMHHKAIIIDGRVTIFGSFNYSSNADRSNDENLLIVEEPGLAAAFEAEYQRVRAAALNPPVRR